MLEPNMKNGEQRSKVKKYSPLNETTPNQGSTLLAHRTKSFSSACRAALMKKTKSECLTPSEKRSFSDGALLSFRLRSSQNERVQDKERIPSAQKARRWRTCMDSVELVVGFRKALGYDITKRKWIL